MRIDIITVLPELIQGFMQESIVGRAQKKGLVEIHIHNLRDYTLDKWRRVDDYPFGGFAGMVMKKQEFRIFWMTFIPARGVFTIILSARKPCWKKSAE